MYQNLSVDLKNRQTFVKALCLNVAHTCNLTCDYCFASQGKYNGDRAIMKFEVGKQAIDLPRIPDSTVTWTSTSSAVSR